jgi:hypothetical protein
MPFKPGQPRPANAGRKPGVPNKVTRAMREDWLEAYERRGGVEFLMTLDNETFAKGLLRMVPNEVAAKLESEVKLRIIDRSDTRKEDDGVA